MIIKVYALFTSSEDATDDEDGVHRLIDEIITQTEITEDGDIKTTTLVPTSFDFDMHEVWAINRSMHKGYSTIRLSANDSYSIKMPFEKLERLFRLCRG